MQHQLPTTWSRNGACLIKLVLGQLKIQKVSDQTKIWDHKQVNWYVIQNVNFSTNLIINSYLIYTNLQIDSEIKRILTESYDRAKSILKIHAKEHKALAEALLKYETLDAEDIKAILSGEKRPTDIAN